MKLRKDKERSEKTSATRIPSPQSDASCKDGADFSGLAQTESAYRCFFEHSSDAMLLTRPDGSIIAANPRACRLFGRSEEELIREGRAGVVDTADPRLLPALEERARTGQFTGVLTFVRKDGSKFQGEIFSSIYRDSKGDNVNSMIIRDITERKHAEEKITSLGYIIENSLNEIYVCDAKTLKFIEVNAGARQNTGYTAEELRDMTPLDIKPLITREVLLGMIASLESGEKHSVAFETMHRRKDGSLYPVEVRYHLTTFGNTSALVAIIMDITERRQAEQEMAEREMRFRQLFDNMSSGAVVYQVVDDGEDFIVKDINLASMRIENVSREDVVGKRLTEVFPGVRDFGLFAVLQKVWRTGNSESYSASYYQDSKRESWRENFVYKLPSGEIIAIYNDITERMRDEEKIAHLASFPEFNPNPVAEIARDGTVLYANAAARQIFCEPGTTGAKVPHLADWDDITAKLIGSADDYINREINVHERFYILTIQYLPLTGMFRIYAHDITERKLADEKVRESQRLYSTLVDNLPGFVYRCANDRDWTMYFISDGCRAITGYEPDDLIQNRHLSYNDLVRPDYRETLWLKWQKCLDKKETFESEYPIIAAGGETRWVWERGRGIFDDEGKLLLLEGFITDVTEHKKAEAELQKYELMASNSNDIILFLDSNSGRILEANAAAVKAYGYSRDELLTKTLKDLRAPDTLDTVEKQIRKADSEGILFETKHKRRDSSLFPVEVSSRGTVVGGQRMLVSIIRDITERKRTEAEIIRLNRLYAVVSQINQAVVHAITAEQFLNTVCDVITRYGQFKLAWIGQIDHESKRMLPVAAAGVARDYVDGIIVYTDSRPEGLGPVGTCIREQKPFIQNDFINEPNTQSWQEKAKQYGFHGAAAFPIIAGNEVWGALAVYSDTVGFFGNRETELLEEASGDIGFALDNMEKEKLRLLSEDNLRKTAAELRESEERFRSLYENSAMGIYRTTPEGRVLLANPMLVKMLGYSGFDEFARQPIAKEIFDPSFPRSFFLEKIEKDGVVKGLESIWRRKDGTPVYIRESAHAIRDSGGKTLYYDGTVEDITGYKEAQEALKAFEEKYQLIAENMSEMVLLMDLQFKHSYISPSFERIRGFTLDEYNNLPLEKNLTPDSILVMQQHFAEQFTPERLADKNLPIVFGYEIEVYRKDGSVIPVQDTINLIRNADGTPSAIMIVSRDMTERKKAEQEKQHFREKAEMSSRLAAVGEMAAGIAHEINNPLTSILGFSELLMEHDLPSDVKDELKIIADGSQRVADIVKRLLTFARHNKTVKTSVNVNNLIDNTIKLRAYVLQTANIRVFTCYEEDLPWIVADPGQLQQVFLNLIVNAEHAMKNAHNGGELKIITEKLGQKIRITFSDDGPGIAAGNMKRLFEPFFTTKGPSEGTGLGLSLSRSIVLEHNGEIWAESKEGNGCTFVVELPFTETPSPENRTKSDTPEASVTAGTSAKIMVIDDEQSIREYLQTVLGASGYDVVTCGDPHEALKSIDDSYDAVLLDIRMPGMSGTDLYAYIMQKVPALDGRIIFITGDTSDRHLGEFFTKNRLKYMAKPLKAEALKELVLSVIKASRQANKK